MHFVFVVMCFPSARCKINNKYDDRRSTLSGCYELKLHLFLIVPAKQLFRLAVALLCGALCILTIASETQLRHRCTIDGATALFLCLNLSRSFQNTLQSQHLSRLRLSCLLHRPAAHRRRFAMLVVHASRTVSLASWRLTASPRLCASLPT